MSDQTNGLRFDVYERVHLPDDVAAIDELEEIELVPRIQVIDQGDHAVLKGQLLLSGVYRGQKESESPLALEHWIPVEITLPMNRISRLDDISIEIDNFDVDLLSARTLNITGVLSLRGISAQPIQEQDEDEVWREEPFTVVHEREAFDERQTEASGREPAYEEAAYIPEETEAESESFVDLESQREADEAAVTISSASPETVWSSSQLFASPPQQREQNGEEERANEATGEQPEADSWLSASSPFAEEAQQEPETERSQDEDQIPQAPSYFELQQEQEAEPELEPEKQELRIALNVKQPENEGGQGVNVGFQTLLQTSRREQAARQAAEETARQEQAEVREPSGDEIEWKTLFLGKQSEEREFRKIRMCIVQRDETLEAIATRYSLNPREILIYNRLEESDVSEGRLLYIP
ncbi:LysM peptidoglycan-binding domain-containing protein [Paenibacillus arenilitoris]|uniref:LysM peptidoglycan-binding domain-containing protein n=1 Tax=Paenibacillus arenilitoris TaxID=2772299 RepID=A0A927CNC4_9BACL|nr:LysM peptidoglycan-binding domain-containing protein [Paenibacillus arenilitoris]MBD2870462.1 LysM peptidoglycan-binding domain-containing protein [Paenibacillus arenilitoris]